MNEKFQNKLKKLEKAWQRFLVLVKKHGVYEQIGIERAFSDLNLDIFDKINLEWIALKAYDLKVPLFTVDRKGRSLLEIQKDIAIAQDALHKKIPPHPEKCPKCGGQSRVVLKGYPGALMNGAARLGYISFGGCIGWGSSSTTLSCAKCDNEWGSKLSYGFEIFDHLKQRYSEKADPAIVWASVDKYKGCESLGNCPKCGAEVIETDIGYQCRNTAAYSPSCRLLIFKKIKEKKISKEDVRDILNNGRSRTLTFRRGKKSFPGFVVVGENGFSSLNWLQPERVYQSRS